MPKYQTILIILFIACVAFISCERAQQMLEPATLLDVPKGMVLIPSGEFQMGSNNRESDTSEQPPHTVYVDAFYMDAYEVTNAQYKKFIEANPQWQKDTIDERYHEGSYLGHWDGNVYPSGTADHPVVFVSWYAAMAYADWVGKRLPTEAEWERAARGGLVGKKYPWGDSIDSSNANYGKHIGSAVPVGQYAPNAYGLYDMVGNVWEWCLDEYDADFYAISPRDNPIAGARTVEEVTSNFLAVKTSRVFRGGAWLTLPEGVRVANRFKMPPAYSNFYYGFRCVRSVAP